MIKLENETLSFSFPEVAAQLRALFERQFPEMIRELLSPEERQACVKELKSWWGFQQLGRARQEKLKTRVATVTADEVAKMLKQAALSIGALHHGDQPTLKIEFHRTLRIPDDGRLYPLPAGLGRFPLRSVDDFPASAPRLYLERGGVMMPMYQGEALWLGLSSNYPFALKIAAGKINAVSGAEWGAGLQEKPQDYVVVPEQPWLDGFSVGEGVICQFVAMPLGEGYSVEEQLTGRAENGGMQLQVYPLSAEAQYRDSVAASLPSSLVDLLPWLIEEPLERENPMWQPRRLFAPPDVHFLPSASMGLGAGGTMRQEIYEDPHDFADWDQSHTRRCFVHLCNSLAWREITGANPPHPPFSAKEYHTAGIPWFDYYRDDLSPLSGSKRLAGVKSIRQVGKESKAQVIPECSIAPEFTIQYGNTRRPGEIRAFPEEC